MRQGVLGSFWNPQAFPLFVEHWALSCHASSPGGQSPTCMQTLYSQRWAQSGWWCLKISGAWQTWRWVEVQLLVHREKSRGERTQTCGDQVQMFKGSEACLPSFTYCFLSLRKSVIHLQMELGTLSLRSLSCSRAGMMVLKAKLKSTNKILAFKTFFLS